MNKYDKKIHNILDDLSKGIVRDLNSIVLLIYKAYEDKDYKLLDELFKKLDTNALKHNNLIRENGLEFTILGYKGLYDDAMRVNPIIRRPKTPTEYLKMGLNASRKFIYAHKKSKLMTFEKVLVELGYHEKKIIKKTHDLIRKALESGFGIEKASRIIRNEIIDSIPNHFDKGKLNYEIQRVLRTELLRARSVGNEQAFESIDPKLGLVKVWDSTEDRRTRKQHREMNGKRANSKGVFTFPDGTTTKQPRMSGKAHQDIMCRCVSRVISI